MIGMLRGMFGLFHGMTGIYMGCIAVCLHRYDWDIARYVRTVLRND